jgi:predicted nucleic acid-binding protein
MTHLVILDSEAVQALQEPAHPKHRQVVSHTQVVVSRKRRAAGVELVVPTAVRVEAGWNRNSAAWAFPNQLRIADLTLDSVMANAAATIRHRSGVSVADAHLGAVIQSALPGPITVVTSDPADMSRVAGDRAITVAAI